MNIPRFKEGQVLNARDLNLILAELERLGGLSVSSPLEMVNPSSSPPMIAYRPRPLLQYAVVTTQAPAFNTTTKVYGKGAATLEVESYSAADVCTGALTSPVISFVFYNGGKDSIDVGHRIQVYEKVPGRMHAVTEFCV